MAQYLTSAWVLQREAPRYRGGTEQKSEALWWVEGGKEPPSPSRFRGLTTSPAMAAQVAKRRLFDKGEIYLSNKFADQLILVTAALPRINYREFKYNHWLIPTSSGPRLAIHPR